VTFSQYLVGVVALAATTVPLALGARAVQRVVVPDWHGPLAWLASSTVWVALLIGVAEVLGTIGALRRGPLVVTSLAVGLTLAIGLRPRSSAGAAAAEPNAGPWTALVLGLAALALAVWVSRSIGALRTGVLGYDSLNYHMPFAARFFQTGRTTDLHFTFYGNETPVDPASSELVHAVGLVLLRRDLLSPLINIGWLVLALLASWCAGVRRGAPTAFATLAASCIVLTAPRLVTFDGGRATNDVMGLALMLAAVAMLLAAHDRPGVVGLAAVAAGTALGSKLSMVLPVALLTIGVIVVADRARRVRVSVVWLGWLVVTGGYWYARNLARTGSPMPALHLGIGAFGFPSAHIHRVLPSHSVAHYAGHPSVWRHAFLPGLHAALGVTWPLAVGLTAAGIVLALVRGDRFVRMLGVVSILGLVGYAVTPNSAAGAGGTLFGANLRFAFPSIVIALVALGLAVPGLATAWRWTVGAAIALALAANLAYGLGGHARDSIAALLVVAGIALLALGAVLGARATSAVGVVVAVAVVLVVAVVAGGWRVQRSYADRRYRTASPLPYAAAPGQELDALMAWVRTAPSGSRIALGGLGASYLLDGPTSSNHVQYVGHRRPHGAFDPATSCSEWRRELRDGDYDYVVVSADIRTAPTPREARWTRTDPAARPVLHVGSAYVFRVVGAFHPDACAS
jgi:hypothetical protein